MEEEEAKRFLQAFSTENGQADSGTGSTADAFIFNRSTASLMSVVGEERRG